MFEKDIRRQCKQIFQNIDILFSEFTEKEFDLIKGGFLVWKQFYHLVHSLDKNFCDPSNYVEPKFHKMNLDVVYLNEDHLSKKQIYDYYIEVKSRVERYLDNIDDNGLSKKIEYKGMELSKLELILAQLRHIFYHIGYMHCFLKIERGETPEYIGLYKVKIEK